ncbi:MAG: tetratricopeptide repeat protein [Nitrosopumilus sp.]|nr:tetratricopeptide repeat protein [Nitrosopumilus sp.]
MNEKLKDDVQRSKDFLQKAYNLQMKGQFEEAILNYKISLDLHPTPEAYTFLGWAYSFLGDLDKAIQECKNAIAIDPEYGNPYNDIGAYLIQQNRHDEAVTWLELALKSKRYDNFHFAHLNLGKVFEFKGLWFEAVEEYRKAFSISPDYLLAKQHFNRLQGMLN